MLPLDSSPVGSGCLSDSYRYLITLCFIAYHCSQSTNPIAPRAKLAAIGSPDRARSTRPGQYNNVFLQLFLRILVECDRSQGGDRLLSNIPGRTPTKKPGFFRNQHIITKYSREKPGFWLPAHSDKETGFFAKSVHHNQVFWKKPGFWLPAHKSYQPF